VVAARAHFNLPWEPSSYVMGLIMLDRVSNRIQVTLDSGVGFDVPAIKAYTKAQSRPAPSPVYPVEESTLPNYRKNATSPELPDDGVNIKVKRVIEIKNAYKIVLQGSFRLKVLPGEINDGGKDSVHGAIPAAIIPITLLITGSESIGPIVVTVRAPSYDQINANEKNQYVTGYFAIDLLKVNGIDRKSTRLNSSHLVISYAVFCLKKKTQIKF